MDASHFDTATVYAAVNRFRLDDLHPYIYRTHDGGQSWQKIVDGIPENEPVNSVREDPERRGLLFAGTERTVYVSFDDGDHWQLLRLNLPATSIRDLVIHQDDVVIGTHGRSFWILDNIIPLRRLSPQVAESDVYFYPPQVTYRVRRNNNTDTPLPPEEPAGKNPPDGAMIDYFLKSPANGPVVLEISDDAGRLVRRFSSADNPETLDANQLNIPTYWIRPPQGLSDRAGMHRFLWDLHYPPPDSLQHEYPISAIYRDTPRYPLGPFVLPGQYTVRLTVDGRSYTQSLTIRMDPRVKSSMKDLRQQFELESNITTAVHLDYQVLRQVRSLRQQLNSIRERVRERPLVESITALDQKLQGLEGNEERGTFLSTPQGRSLARLNVGLTTLLAAVDSADVSPTTQQLTTFNNVKNALDQQLANWDQIKRTDIPAMNLQLRQSGLSMLNPESGAVIEQRWHSAEKAVGED